MNRLINWGLQAATLLVAISLRPSLLSYHPTPDSFVRGMYTLCAMAAADAVYEVIVRTTNTPSEAAEQPRKSLLNAVEYISLGLLAGLAEEFFFRGLLQPVVGVFVASVVFGAAHLQWGYDSAKRRVTWERKRIPYAGLAAVSGVVLGMSCIVTGDIWVPVIAHVSANAIAELRATVLWIVQQLRDKAKLHR